MISLARSIPARDSRKRAHHRSASRLSTNGCNSVAIAFPDIHAVTRLHGTEVDAAVSRRPVNSASSSASCGRQLPPLRRRAVLPAATAAMYSVVDDRFFQRTPPRVECAPQPKPSHSPSVQYFRLWRDSRPAARRWRSRTARSPPRRVVSIASQIHLRRVVIRGERPLRRAPSRRGAAHSGYSSSR